jgi:hypothetical protein
MKRITGWNAPNTGASDSSGFAGLPGGYRGIDCSFLNIGLYGMWWSSTEYNSADAHCRYMNYGQSNGFSINNVKIYGFSVRCIKD